MNIVIERADRIAFEAAGHGDFSFVVEAYAQPEFDKAVADWEKIPVASYSKDYDDTGKEDAFGDETALFIAKAGGKPAGRMALSRSWNRYALLDTIGVARNFRGQGIGHALLEQAIAWARTKGMPRPDAGNAEQQSRRLPALREARVPPRRHRPLPLSWHRPTKPGDRAVLVSGFQRKQASSFGLTLGCPPAT